MSNAIGTAELNAMRDLLEADLLPDTCDILTPTRTQNSAGGWTQSWGTATASVRCRLDPMTGREAVAAGAQLPFYGYKLTLPHDATLTTNMRVKIASISYDVRSVDSNKSWAASVRAIVERVP